MSSTGSTDNPSNKFDDTSAELLFGKFKLFIGCMFATKTTHMVSEVERYHLANKLCIVIKYEGDTRYDQLASSGGIVTHAHREYARVPVKTATYLTEIVDFVEEYEVIGVDEVQFFPDAVEIIQKWANSGKIIIASGLDANYLAKPFLRMPELIAIAEDVIKLKAVCMSCGADASFTKRTSNDKTEIAIGAADKYIAVCRYCYNHS